MWTSLDIEFESVRQSLGRKPLRMQWPIIPKYDPVSRFKFDRETGRKFRYAVAMNGDGTEWEHCYVPGGLDFGTKIPFLSLPESCQVRVLKDIRESFF
jgi:hypothetical protein